MRRSLKLWVPALAWMGVIFFLSSLSRPAPRSLASIPDWIAHPAVYAVLGFLLCRTLSGGRPLVLGHGLLAVVLSTAYGITDEWHQSFTPLRDPSALDVLKDLIGGIVGAAAYAWLGPSRFGPSNKRESRA